MPELKGRIPAFVGLTLEDLVARLRKAADRLKKERYV